MDRESEKAMKRRIFAPLLPILSEIFSATLVINVLAFAVPIFVLQVYDRVIAQAGVSTLQGLIIGMAGVIVFDFILRQARSSLLQDAALRIDARLGKQLFAKFSALPLRILEKKSAQYWQAMFHDVDTIRTAIAGVGAILLADLPFVLIGVVLILAIAQPLAWALLIIVPLFLLLAFLSNWSAQNASLEERTATMRRDALVGEMITDRTTIKSLGLGRHLATDWEARQVGTIDSAIKRAARADRYHNLAKMLLLSSTVTLTGFGAIAIINQELTIGALIAANMLVTRILQPLNQLVFQWKTVTAAHQAYGRIKKVLTYPEDRWEETIRLARPKGKVTMQELAYKYAQEDTEPVLQDITAKFGPTGLHGVVGTNGSGKTTLLKCLRGLYRPTSGHVMIDEADLDQFSEYEKLTWFSYVPQETRLLSGSIKENLAMGALESDDDKIVAAAKTIGLHNEILSLPQGYNTAVGEHGDDLSGGLRQKIALARALANDPVVMLLDEPSNNLDLPAERNLAATLKKLGQKRTVIIVTHSTVLLEACTSIMVLEKGKLKAGGRAGDILARLKAAGR